MKKRITALMMVMVLCAMSLMLTACGSGPVGFWKVEQITTGDTVMTEEDAQAVGLTQIGTIKLQKSGNCVVLLVGEENEGTWTQSDDGTIEIKFGEDRFLMGSIDEEGVMTLTDDQGSIYTLEK